MSQPDRYYCNTGALSVLERKRHQQMTGKLITLRRQVVETDGGYEFQFSPSDVSLAELADWTSVEARCCPFFDFHLDLERAGQLLCLRLTGEEGVKPFIRAEFQISEDPPGG